MIQIQCGVRGVRFFGISAFSFLLSILLSSCLNIYSPLESPSGDAQNLSHARACFDDGDLKCAREYYLKLSTNYADIQASELAFAILDENGAGMQIFIEAFGNGQGGPGITKLANYISAKGASPTVRGNFESAFLQNTLISNTNLAALVRFVSAAGMIGEVLAETTGADGVLQKTDIAVATSCASSATPACLADTNCNSGAGGLANGTGAITTLTTQTSAGIKSQALTLDLLMAAATDASNALTAMGVSGKFKDGLKKFTDALIAVGGLGGGGGTFNRCFRQVLLSNSVGA